MQASNFHKIGFVSKTHGLKGEVKISLEVPDLSFENLEALFLDISQPPIPYFIQKIEVVSADWLIIKFEDTDSVEEAQKLTGLSVYVSSSKALPAIAKENQFDELEIFDSRYGKLGKIREVLTLPGQLVAQLTYREKELLIPLNEKTIIKVDNEAGILYTNIPDGLLEVFE